MLNCVTSFQNGAATVPITGGMCTRSCTLNTECAPFGGSCFPVGDDQLCLPNCTASCTRVAHACCQYSNPVPVNQLVCVPPAAPNFNVCSS